MPGTAIGILLIFLLLLLNGVFAMSEIAIVSSRKVRLQQKADEGDTRAKAALDLANTPNRFLSTLQIGITLVGILAGALGGATLAEKLAVWLEQFSAIKQYSGGIALAIVVIVTTYFSLVIGELIPKRLGLLDPERVAMAAAKPMRFLSRLTAPLVKILSVSTDFGLRLLGASASKEPLVTEEEIKVLMEQGTQIGIFEEAEQDMIEGVFRLNDRPIDSIMTPRTEIEWLDLDETPQEIMLEIKQSMHTRFPVAQDNLDNVIGILTAKDFLENMLSGEEFNINDLLQPPLFVPDSMTTLKTLERIKTSGVHEALVLDEYGGLLGMVTLYDILKAIVGEIPGPGDLPEPQAVQRDDGSWLMDGLLSIDELKEVLAVDALPDEDRIGYQTLGGFVMSQLGHIPNLGQWFEWNAMRFEVVDMDGRRVDKVLVTGIPTNSEDVST